MRSPKVTQLEMAGAAPPQTLGSEPSCALPWPGNRLPLLGTFISQAAERPQALQSHFPMPESHGLPSGPSTIPVAAPAPGILGRPLTPHTNCVALDQIPCPLGMGRPHLLAAPWNGPQPELDTVPAATQEDTTPNTCEHLRSTYCVPSPMQAQVDTISPCYRRNLLGNSICIHETWLLLFQVNIIEGFHGSVLQTPYPKDYIVYFSSLSPAVMSAPQRQEFVSVLFTVVSKS